MSNVTRQLKDQANRGDMLARMVAIAEYLDDRHSCTALALVNTLQVHFGHKPPGFDALIEDIGCSLLHEMIENEKWIDEDIALISWGIPLESLKVYKKQHLRLKTEEGREVT